METPKHPVNMDWLNQFEYLHLWDDYAWLLKLGIQTKTIVNFGCWTGVEPFVLLWMFDASEIAVVEIDQRQIEGFKKRTEALRTSNPPCLAGRSIRPIVADMSVTTSELSSNYFDLAFCENVLYNLKINQPDYEGVQSAISEMTRVVRPGGYVVAFEPKMGVEFEMTNDFWSLPVPLNDPIDINDLFAKAGLVKLNFDKLSPYRYVYRKPTTE